MCVRFMCATFHVLMLFQIWFICIHMCSISIQTWPNVFQNVSKSCSKHFDEIFRTGFGIIFFVYTSTNKLIMLARATMWHVSEVSHMDSQIVNNLFCRYGNIGKTFSFFFCLSQVFVFLITILDNFNYT